MHPLSIFIESLRTHGFQPTPHDYHRIHLALQAGGEWQMTQLRDILATLLVKSPEQDVVFQQRFKEFFQKPEQAATLLITSPDTQAKPAEPDNTLPDSPKTPPKPRQAKKRGWQFWLWFIFIVLIIVGGGIGYQYLYHPKMSVQANQLDFGGQIIRTKSQNTFEIENLGLAPLPINQVTLPETEEFKIITDNCSHTTVARGSLCTIDIQFTPQQTIDYSTTLTIPNNTGTSQVSIRGSGIHPVAIQPRFVVFGEQTISTNSQKAIEIVNLGDVPATIDNIALLPNTKAFQILTDNCSNVTLTNESCTIDIQFTPQQTIDYTATLIIPYGTDKSQVLLMGSGIEAIQPEQSQRLYPDVPFIKNITPIPNPAQDEWKTYGIMVAILFLLLLIYGIWLWRSRRLPKDNPPIWHSDKPRLFSVGKVGGKPQPRLSPAVLDQLADSIGYFYNEQTGKQIDTKQSIIVTLQSLIPTLIFSPRKQVCTVVILEDALAKPLAWNPIAQELATGLMQRRITVLYGSFYGSPQQFHTAQGISYDLTKLPYESEAYILLIFSDGKSLRYHRDALILDTLSQWDQVAWMELREKRAWDESTTLPAHFGLPIYPASVDGLLQAIGNFLSEYGSRQNELIEAALQARGLPVQIGDNLAAYVEILLGDALPWAQSCAMLQPVSLGLADALRCRFFDDLPPERIERLFTLPKTISTTNGLHFAKPIIAVLRTGFSVHFCETEQEQILQFILDKLKKAEPEDKQSPAHLAWEWRWQRVYLEVEPDKALQRLAELAGEGSPLQKAIQVELENTAPPPKKNITIASNEHIPLRKNPISQIALQRLQRIAKDSGIPKLSVLPVRIGQWVTLSLLISSLSGLSYISWNSYVTTQPQPPYQVELVDADNILAWGVWQNNGSLQYVSSSEKVTLPADSERLTFLSQTSFIQTQEIDKLIDNAKIELAYDEKNLSCLESFPEIGLTVQRCPDDTRSSSVDMPTWHESLTGTSVQNQLMSVGLAIQTNPADELALQVLRQTLLETHSLDILYRITPATDGELHLADALTSIQTQLAPWHQHSQLIGWVVGDQANNIQVNDFIATFGSGLILAQSLDLSWVAAVQKLFTANETPIITAAEMKAALGKPVEAIALLRQRSLASLLKTCQEHLEANRLTSGKGGNALACYQEILKKVPTHAQALAGLKEIEARYVTLIENALTQGQQNQAEKYLAGLRKVNPNSRKLAKLEGLEIQLQLDECNQHFLADRLTTGSGGTAFACYQDVLEKEPENAEALAGLEKIEKRYVTLIKRELGKGQLNKAKTFLTRLYTVNPQSLLLVYAQLEIKVVECDKHFQADRLMTGESGTALACYKEVLQTEPNNAVALAGLEKIEAHYRTLIEKAWKNKQSDQVDNYLETLRQVNPTSEIFAEIESLRQEEQKRLALETEKHLALETETRRYQTDIENALDAGKLKEARQNLQHLRKINPNLPALLTLQQRVLELQNREEISIEQKIITAIEAEKLKQTRSLLTNLREVNPNSQVLSKFESLMAKRSIFVPTEKKIALVIGNEAYQKAPLTTPGNDARDMDTALRQAGFEVILKINADQFTMEKAINEFRKQLQKKGGVGLFYYSGYGVQYEQENFLIPIGTISTIKVPRYLRFKTVSLNYVLAVMKWAKNDLNIILMDACRDNPLGLSKSMDKGLARVVGAENMVIGYATTPGRVASKSQQRNSFYTKHLLRLIKQSDLPIEFMLEVVQSAVKQENNGKQTPWYESSLKENFWFIFVGYDDNIRRMSIVR